MILRAERDFPRTPRHRCRRGRTKPRNPSRTKTPKSRSSRLRHRFKSKVLVMFVCILKISLTPPPVPSGVESWRVDGIFSSSLKISIVSFSLELNKNKIMFNIHVARKTPTWKWASRFFFFKIQAHQMFFLRTTLKKETFIHDS